MKQIDINGIERNTKRERHCIAFIGVLITIMLLMGSTVYADEKIITSFPIYIYGFKCDKLLVKEIKDKFILEDGELTDNGLFDGSINTFKQANLIVPYLSYFNTPIESASLFYFMAGRSKYVDEYFNIGKERENYIVYAEILKDLLFKFDLDLMIKSGKYKEKEINDLECLKDEGIITNINSVIMWTALQTRNIDYVEKTYSQLKEYNKIKPKYLEYYLEVFEGVREPLPPFDDLTMDNLIKNIKKARRVR